MQIQWVVLITLASGCLGFLYGRYRQHSNDRSSLNEFAGSTRKDSGENSKPLSDQARLSLYQKILDTLSDAIIVRDATGRVIFFNKTWREFTEVEEADLYNEKELVFSRFMLADGVTPTSEEDTPMSQAQHGHATKHRLLYLRTNTVIPVLVSGYPLLDESQVQTGAMAVVRDFTEIRETELELERERLLLHTIIKALPDAFVFRNMDGKAILVNDAMRQLRRQTGEDQFMDGVVHGNFLDGSTGEEIEDGQTPIERSLRGDTVVREGLTQRRGTQTIDLLATSIPVYDNTGEQYGAFSILQDVTTLKKATEHRQKARRAQALHNLAAGVAHDFNNQLGAILGNAQLAMNQQEDSEDFRHHLQAIVDAVNTSTKLTRRLITLGNTSGGDPEPINVQEVLSKFVSDTQAVFENYIDLTVTKSESTLLVYCDKAQIESALLNLLLNAKDATNSTIRPRVSVRFKRVGAIVAETKGLEAGVDYASIEVVDNGTGFTSQSREEAFDPFYSTKPESSGGGLGLTMVEGFVRQYGGQVTISDRYRELTHVEMLLPLLDTKELITLQPRVDVERVRGDGETVLVVEDRLQVLTSTCEMLSLLNYRTVSAHSAEEGLLLLDENLSIVLVLVDVMLGDGMNGVAMMKVVKKRRPDVKFIYTSGYAGNRREISFPKTRYFLQKPYELETMSQMIHQLIGQPVAENSALTEH